MVLAGSYAIWYGRWELAVYDGDLSDDPVVDRIENLRLWFVAEIHRIGAGRLTLAVVIAIVATIAVARLARPTTSTVEAPHQPGPSST